MPHYSVKLSISTEAVAGEVYALSALRSYLAADSTEMPHMLGPDNRTALMPVIRSAFLRVALESVSGIESINPGEETDTVMPLTVKLRAGTPQDTVKALRKAIESAVAMATLSACFAGCDTDAAESFEALLAAHLATVRSITGTASVSRRITPYSM